MKTRQVLFLIVQALLPLTTAIQMKSHAFTSRPLSLPIKAADVQAA